MKRANLLLYRRRSAAGCRMHMTVQDKAQKTLTPSSYGRIKLTAAQSTFFWLGPRRCPATRTLIAFRWSYA